MAQKPNQGGRRIVAGQVELTVPKGVYDIDVLTQVLNGIATGPITVEDGKVTCSDADVDAVKEILATVGIEVQNTEGEAATAPVVEPTTASVAPAVKADEGNAPADGTPPGTDGDGDAPPGPPSEPDVETGPTAGDGSDILEDGVYASAEKRVNLAGSFQLILTAAQTNNPTWLLIAGSDAVAKVALSAQPTASSIAGFFKTQDYGNSLMQALQKNGVAATLEKVKAQVLTAQAVTPREKVDVQAVRDAGIAEFETCFGMAVQAAQKNYVENPLKDAAFKVLASAGVADPQAVVEQIFAAFPAFHASVTATAKEYMAMDKSQRLVAADMLGKMGTQGAASVRVDRAAADFTRKLVEGSTPVVVPVSEAVGPGSNVTGSTGASDTRAAVRASLLASYPGMIADQA